MIGKPPIYDRGYGDVTVNKQAPPSRSVRRKAVAAIGPDYATLIQLWVRDQNTREVERESASHFERSQAARIELAGTDDVIRGRTRAHKGKMVVAEDASDAGTHRARHVTGGGVPGD